MPMWLLHALSGCLYAAVYRLAGYRRGVVRENLRRAFPDKTEGQRKDIERSFYRWLCDYFVETVKLAGMGQEEMRRRMAFEGIETVNSEIAKGRSVAVYLGHYGQWEWITSLPLWTGAGCTCAEVYHPLENNVADKMFKDVRQRFGSVCVPVNETLRAMAAMQRRGERMVMGFIADQAPFWNNIHHWVDFLHQDTPVLTGAEKIVGRMGMATFYGDVRRTGRGRYVCRFVPMEGGGGEFPLTDTYFRMLEESIRRDPAMYLWTHKRWKRTREEYDIRLDKATGRVDLRDLGEIKREKGLEE